MKPDVVILPSFSQVEDWRKSHASDSSQGLFAQAVTTFDAWMADLWELHGDGRAIIGPMQRQVAMRVAFERAGVPVLPGAAMLASHCARSATGVERFETAVAQARDIGNVDGLSEREVAFLRGIAEYECTLDRAGLVEIGEVARVLALRSDEVFPNPICVLVSDSDPLDWISSQFFEACPQIDLELSLRRGASGVESAPAGVDVRFAFPSGRLAQPGLVADLVCNSLLDGDVVVACKRPLEMFERVHRRLSDVGAHVCVQASVPFAQTDFGRAFLTLFHAIHDGSFDASLLSDAVASFCSGFSRADALAVDTALRADRIVSCEGALMGLRVASDAFSQFEEIVLDPEADILIGVFEQMAQAASNRSEAWRSQQLSAMAALRDAAEAARRMGAGIDACASTLEVASLPASVHIVGDGPTVVFSTIPVIARMGPGSYSTVVACDLTSQDYPVADRDDAVSTLLRKLGLVPADTALARARRDFEGVVDVAAHKLLLVRPLGDDDAVDTYPCAVLEEFVDAYRDDPSATDDIDNAYRIPPVLQSGVIERGEELLFANATCATTSDRQATEESVAPQLGFVGSEVASRVMPVRYDGEGHALSRPCPSPSQVELYLECPFQWFAQRRMRAEDLEEGFGPLEKGSFAHAVLEQFYKRFIQEGFAKVAPDNIDQAKTLMRQVASELAEAQFDAEPRSGRLVPATQLESREVERLCDQLVSFLDFEARLMPAFHPAYFEYQITADDPVDYAGYQLVGAVDRIDVDDTGHAVIIDYKGSVNSEHEIAGKVEGHAGKVQTRIYARAVERALGLKVVGALYVSNGKRPGLAGAYDPRVLEAAHLPFMKHDKCACGTLESVPGELDELDEGFSFEKLAFDVMLDETERIVGNAIERMAAGDVAPEPSSANACRWCPVASCPKRGD